MDAEVGRELDEKGGDGVVQKEKGEIKKVLGLQLILWGFCCQWVAL
jgi:hypothetical protein